MKYDQLTNYNLSKINYFNNNDIKMINPANLNITMNHGDVLIYGIKDDAIVPEIYQLKESSSMGSSVGCLAGSITSSFFNRVVKQNRLGDFSFNNKIYEIKTYKYEQGVNNKDRVINFNSTVQPSSAKGEGRNTSKQYKNIDYFVFIDSMLFKNFNTITMTVCSFNTFFPKSRPVKKYTNVEIKNVIDNLICQSVINNKIIYI